MIMINTITVKPKSKHIAHKHNLWPIQKVLPPLFSKTVHLSVTLITNMDCLIPMENEAPALHVCLCNEIIISIIIFSQKKG